MGKQAGGVATGGGSSGALTQAQAISYALPIMISAMLMAPMNIVQGIYAKYYGISLGSLALIILCARIFDAVTDPLIGYLSDSYQRKHGTRKPFMVAGLLLMVVCGYFLYVPPATISSAYAALWMIVFYAAYTLFYIPYITWPCDIVSESGDRAKLYTYCMTIGFAALALFYCIPLLPVFPSNDITPETLKFAYFLAAALSVPFLFLAMRAIPSGEKVPTREKVSDQTAIQSIQSLACEMISNKPFMIFSGAFLFGAFSIGMASGLVYIYVDAYLGMGDQFAELLLISMVVGTASGPIWYRLVLMAGKKTIFILTMLMLLLSYIAIGSLNPGTASFNQLLVIQVVQITAFVGGTIVSPTMLAEITDYAHWKTGVERNATYFSAKVFFEKAAIAIGTGLGLAIAGAYGFVVTDTDFSPNAILGLKLGMVWVPSLFGIISLVFMVLTPINERRHRIIKQRLDARIKRSAALAETQPHKTSAHSQPQEIGFNAP